MRSALPGPTGSLAIEHVAAEFRDDLSLRDRRARQACARAGRELSPGNFWRLVRFEMRPKAAWTGRKEVRHAPDVPLHRRDVDDDRRGRDIREAASAACAQAISSSSPRRDGAMPKLRIFRYRLLRSMPSTSAVREMFPCCAASARRM